jgi:NADH-quinone oxidoreductase subunit I
MLGSGIIKGMAETARNSFGSYTDEKRLVTVEYPEARLPPEEAARNFPFLVYDGNDPMAGLRCVACQICEKECPPQCIYIIKDAVKKPDYMGKMQVQPKVFDIDISVCMSCQICVEVCPFEAIKMDTTSSLKYRPLWRVAPVKEQLAQTSITRRSIRRRRTKWTARPPPKTKAEAKAKLHPQQRARLLRPPGSGGARRKPKAPNPSAPAASPRKTFTVNGLSGQIPNANSLTEDILTGFAAVECLST